MLAAFLLITVVLSATSVQALFTLEHLAMQSREAARQAIKLTEEAQRLAERTVAMERSARQYLVLDDSAFRDRYDQARQEARAALQALSAGVPGLPAGEVDEWIAQSDAASAVVNAGKKRSRADELTLSKAFARLPQINDDLGLESKREIARRNDALLSDLEHRRAVLTALVALAVSLSVLLALGFGVWLSRPLARIEAAISRLGENRFDQAIEVGGPADMRLLGQQLNWLRLRLAELESDKSRFLRHISHELNTPLAALCEGVALLEDEVAGKLSVNQREVAGILRQNTQSLQTQIEDLLRYNAAAFCSQNLRRVAVDLERLLNQVIDEQRLQWQARSVQIRARLGDHDQCRYR
ncbi:MAG: histidine kinase dimerization/phospho-acceptor domain-containing protein [Burkholderiales bacterium]